MRGAHTSGSQAARGAGERTRPARESRCVAKAAVARAAVTPKMRKCGTADFRRLRRILKARSRSPIRPHGTRHTGRLSSAPPPAPHPIQVLSTWPRPAAAARRRLCPCAQLTRLGARELPCCRRARIRSRVGNLALKASALSAPRFRRRFPPQKMFPSHHRERLRPKFSPRCRPSGASAAQEAAAFFLRRVRSKAVPVQCPRQNS
mmetsp:Transcript_54331/g.151294  ORF Transcript_54331/g.151294 Transcript_54331/m.151294 type:complete len:205 (+) Transcript_54331:513-1127(+)